MKFFNILFIIAIILFISSLSLFFIYNFKIKHKKHSLYIIFISLGLIGSISLFTTSFILYRISYNESYRNFTKNISHINKYIDNTTITSSNYNKHTYGLVITCYNRPEYLQQTFNSLLEADLSNTLICIINDYSSNPEIYSLIQKFSQQKNCLIVNNPFNMGIMHSLLKGFEILKKNGCKFLLNLDSDVLVKPDFIQKLRDLYDVTTKKYDKHSPLISGFNCGKTCKHEILNSHTTSNISFYEKKSIGGINMFFDINLYNKIIVNVLNKIDFGISWDWKLCNVIIKNNHKILVNNPSVIQHIGIEGLNSGKSLRNSGHLADIAIDF